MWSSFVTAKLILSLQICPIFFFTAAQIKLPQQRAHLQLQTCTAATFFLMHFTAPFSLSLPLSLFCTAVSFLQFSWSIDSQRSVLSASTQVCSNRAKAFSVSYQISNFSQIIILSQSCALGNKMLTAKASFHGHHHHPKTEVLTLKVLLRIQNQQFWSNMQKGFKNICTFFKGTLWNSA